MIDVANTGAVLSGAVDMVNMVQNMSGNIDMQALSGAIDEMTKTLGTLSGSDVQNMLSEEDMRKFEKGMKTAGMLGMLINLFQIAAYLLTSWGLWTINKKLGEPNPWMSWVPVLNIYSYVRAAGKPNIWILWLILGLIAFVIPGIIIAIIMTHAISKRTGGGVLRTLGFIFFPFVAYPLIASKFVPAVQSGYTPAEATIPSTPAQTTPTPTTTEAVTEVIPPSPTAPENSNDFEIKS